MGVDSLQALEGHEEEAARKAAQLGRQQAKARASQKAAAKKAAAKGKGKRNQWSDEEEDELSDSSEGGEQAVHMGGALACRHTQQSRAPLRAGRLLLTSTCQCSLSFSSWPCRGRRF